MTGVDLEATIENQKMPFTTPGAKEPSVSYVKYLEFTLLLRLGFVPKWQRHWA